MEKLLLFASIVMIVVVHPSVFGADRGWTAWNNRHYKLVSEETGRLSYAEAEQACSRYCAYLAVPSSQAENDFIWSIYPYKETIGMWIGCRSNEHGNWSCMEGDIGRQKDTQYRHWLSGSLEYLDNPNRCAILLRNAKGQWSPSNSCDYDTKKYFMCEKKIPSSSPYWNPRTIDGL